jgi:hypothetical protein
MTAVFFRGPFICSTSVYRVMNERDFACWEYTEYKQTVGLEKEGKAANLLMMTLLYFSTCYFLLNLK